MRRYLRYFLAPVIAIGAFAAGLSIWLEPLSGDLTRTGFFAERDFGRNGPQPVIKVLANGKTVTHPDVLVLGDSFTEDNLWQSELAEHGDHRILSFLYDHPTCISQWLNYALSRPGPKTVIVQTVEREFVGRYADMRQCRPDRPVTVKVLPSKTDAIRPTWPPALHLSYTFKTVLNTWKRRHTKGTFRSAIVINTPLKPGCAAFSSRRADRLLYYAPDNRKLHWTAQQIDAAAANIRKIQDEFAAHGKRLIFVLVPDKSSAYRDCLADDPDNATRKRINPTQALLAAGVRTPDLMHAFQQNANRIDDLYLPDDTHLSPAGYILMARQIAPLLPPARTAFAAR